VGRGRFVRLCAVLACAAALALSAAPSYADHNFASLSAGAFFPGDEFEGDWDTGIDVGLSYAMFWERLYGVGADLHFYETELSEGFERGEVTTLGIEGLFYLHHDFGGLQPYVGVGAGVYINDIFLDTATMKFDDSGSALGLVGKAGLRWFPKGRLSVGAYGKYFSNKQRIERVVGDDFTIDYGGTIVNFEVGYRF
jgi:hypothetical protein